ESEPEKNWPGEAAQHWPATLVDSLTERLNRADVQAHAANPGPPVVGPPLYGGLHARQTRLKSAAEGPQPAWFRTLNTDARDRVVGGLGTRVVQAEQEDLMLAAWNQVEGLAAANRALRRAQLAMHVSASLHRRHLASLDDAPLLALTERVHPKLLETPGRSVWGALEVSSLPSAVTTGAFRRLARIRGPVVRTAMRVQAQAIG